MLPEKDELSWTKKQLLAKMDVAMGGRVAEEIIYGLDNVSSGAASDFQHATAIATAMVKDYAMSEAVRQAGVGVTYFTVILSGWTSFSWRQGQVKFSDSENNGR